MSIRGIFYVPILVGVLMVSPLHVSAQTVWEDSAYGVINIGQTLIASLKKTAITVYRAPSAVLGTDLLASANGVGTLDTVLCDFFGLFCPREEPPAIFVETTDTSPAVLPTEKLPPPTTASTTVIRETVHVTETPTYVTEQYYPTTYITNTTPAGDFVTYTSFNNQIDAIYDSMDDHGGSFSITSESIETLDDVAAMTKTAGDLLQWNGTVWTNIATSSLGITGSGGLATTDIDTSSELLAILSDETGTGSLVFSASPTFSGETTFANASSTHLTITGTTYLTGLSDGCLELSSGAITSTGSNCGSGNGGVTSLNGLTGSSQTFATSTSGGISLAITSSGSTHTFTAAPAANFTIPVTASTTEWASAYASTTALTPAYLRGLFSNTATGLIYNSSTGATSLTAGYTIPLTASTTNWETAFLWGDHSGEGYLTDITGQSLESLSDVASFTQTTGDLLYWTGAMWSTIATSSLGITGSSGNAAFTIGSGVIYNATSTDNVGIGSTTPSSRLTVQGNTWIGGSITATGTLTMLGTGTSTFSSSIVPSADISYDLGSPDKQWRDVYIGPGSLYINGKKVLEDVSDTITITTDEDQNLAMRTSGVGTILLSATSTGSVTLNSNSGNINISSISGNLNLGTTGSGQLNLGTITQGVWNGTAIGAAYGGTGLTSYSTGDILYASGSNTLAARSVGNAGDILMVSGGVPTWVATSTLGITASSGSGTATTGPAFSVHKNGTDQTITANTETLLTWSAERFDTNSNFDLSTERFTPTVAGKYIVTVTADCRAVAAGSLCKTAIHKNGSQIASNQGTPGDGTFVGSQTTAIIDMNGTTDYLEAFIYSGNTTIFGAATQTYFTGALIAPLYASNSGWSLADDNVHVTNLADLVGIGTSTPAAKLHVQGSSGATDMLAISSSTGSRILTVTAAGNMGIGTIAPAHALEVAGDVKIANTSGRSVLSFGDAGSALAQSGLYIARGLHSAFNADALNFGGFGGYTFSTNDTPNIGGTSTPKMVITTDGDVGIGTTTPSHLLTVAGDANITGALRFSGNAGNAGYVLQSTGSGAEWVATSTLGITASSGSGTATTGPAFSVHKNGTSQSVNDAESTLLTWSTEVFDTNNNFDLSTERFTPTVAGKYLITLNVFCVDSDTIQCIGSILKNGVAVAGSAVSNSTEIVHVSYIVEMNGTTDYLQAYGYDDVSTGSGAISGSATFTNFTGALIAPLYASNSGWSLDDDNVHVTDLTDLVGIGTSTPVAKLHVQGSAGATDILAVSSSTGSRLLTVKATGNVGIGTTTPGNLLDIYSASTNVTALSLINGSSGGAAWNLQIPGSGVSGRVGNFEILKQGTSNGLVINQSGYVGIGTTTPSAPLVVRGGSSVRSTILLDDTDVGGGNLWGIRNGTPGVSNGHLTFRDETNSRNVLVLENTAGYVGIGESSPGHRLSVTYNGSSNGIGSIFKDGDNAASTYPLVFYSGSTQTGNINISSGGTTSYNTSSDRRVKENIDYTSLGIDDLMQIPVRQFSFIADRTHATTTGFIAQELYEIFPWAVSTNGDNGLVPLGATTSPWSVDYGRITPLIVKSVQDINGSLIEILTYGTTTASSSYAFLFEDGEEETVWEKLVTIAQNFVDGVLTLVGIRVEYVQSEYLESNELCLTDDTGTTCVDRTQLRALLEGAGQPVQSGGGGAPEAPAEIVEGEQAPDGAGTVGDEKDPAGGAETPEEDTSGDEEEPTVPPEDEETPPETPSEPTDPAGDEVSADDDAADEKTRENNDETPPVPGEEEQKPAAIEI